MCVLEVTVLVSSNCLECGSGRYSCRQEEEQRKTNVKSSEEKQRSRNKWGVKEEPSPTVRALVKDKEQHCAWKLCSCSLSFALHSHRIETKRNGSGIFLPATGVAPWWFDPSMKKSSSELLQTSTYAWLALYASVYINNGNNENFSCKHENFPICTSYFSFGLRFRIWYEPSQLPLPNGCSIECVHTQ